MTKKTAARVGGLTVANIDPAVAEFRQTAARNRAARTNRQKYDAARKRVRIDCPQWLIDQLDAIAVQLNTSRNQIGAALLAWSTHRYRQDDPDLQEILANSMQPSRSINVAFDIDLLSVREHLTPPAKGPPARK